MSLPPIESLVRGHPLRQAWEAYNEPLRNKVCRPPTAERELAFHAGWNAACMRHRLTVTDEGSPVMAWLALVFFGSACGVVGAAVHLWLVS